jgi:CRP-like cAMP-binding protein
MMDLIKKCKIETFFSDGTLGENIDGIITIKESSIKLSFDNEEGNSQYVGHELDTRSHYHLKGNWSPLATMVLHHIPNSKFINGYFQEEDIFGMIRIILD